MYLYTHVYLCIHIYKLMPLRSKVADRIDGLGVSARVEKHFGHPRVAEKRRLVQRRLPQLGGCVCVCV